MGRALVLKNQSTNARDTLLERCKEMQVQPLGGEDPLEEGMATHSSVVAWRIPMDRGTWQATVHGIAVGYY